MQITFGPVFRTDDDKAIPVVMDAHCPHMGAHMGYGGTIKVTHHWPVCVDPMLVAV